MCITMYQFNNTKGIFTWTNIDVVDGEFCPGNLSDDDSIVVIKILKFITVHFKSRACLMIAIIAAVNS